VRDFVNDRRRPPVGGAASQVIAGSDTASVLNPGAEEPPFDGAYAVLVTGSGRDSRRLYLSLHSASAAVNRARQRGATAALILCRLVPVERVRADR